MTITSLCDQCSFQNDDPLVLWRHLQWHKLIDEAKEKASQSYFNRRMGEKSKKEIERLEEELFS